MKFFTHKISFFIKFSSKKAQNCLQIRFLDYLCVGKTLIFINLIINTMNKAELIDAIAAKAGMTKVDTKKALDAMIDVAKAEMKKDGKIALVGFGTLATTVRPARKGHNPRTGKSIKIAAKKVVKFKPAANILK